jgi:hypothetical protein
MLCREIIDIYCEINNGHVSWLCQQIQMLPLYAKFFISWPILKTKFGASFSGAYTENKHKIYGALLLLMRRASV